MVVAMLATTTTTTTNKPHNIGIAHLCFFIIKSFTMALESKKTTKFFICASRLYRVTVRSTGKFLVGGKGGQRCVK